MIISTLDQRLAKLVLDLFEEAEKFNRVGKPIAEIRCTVGEHQTNIYLEFVEEQQQ